MKTEPLAAAFERLSQHIAWADQFWIGFVFTNASAVTTELADRLGDRLGDRLTAVLRPATPDDLDAVLRAILTQTAPDAVVWVDLARTDDPGWATAWDRLLLRLNERREMLRRLYARGGLVLCGPQAALTTSAATAPDLWTIRSVLLLPEYAPPPGPAVSFSVGSPPKTPERKGPTLDVDLTRIEADIAEGQVHRARAQRRFADALAAKGQLEAALAAAQAAVDGLRAMTPETYDADPGDLGRADALRADLGAALHDFGFSLGALGRREETLAATQEAVAIFRRLADTRPDVFLSDLAKALNNLGGRLNSLGQREEALTATQEAVDIQRRLVDARPDVFLPDLASALTNLGSDLSDMGQREEAIAATQEALDIFRRLADARPDTFLPDLAVTLNNLGNGLSDLGRREEALAATQEALGLYRRLAEAQPDAFLPALAMVLSNLGSDLSGLGRREEALAATQEALDIYRRLADARPDAFLPDLARVLGLLGHVLAALNRHAEARAAAEEALDIYWPFFIDLPAAFAPLTHALLKDCLDRADDGPSEELASRIATFEALTGTQIT